MTLAWMGTKSKVATLTEFRKHIKMDTLIAETYGKMGSDGVYRGCAVGCLTGGNHHELYPELYGIPVQLAYLHDAIFEALSKQDAKAGQEWSYQFLKVIKKRADLSRVFSQLVVWLFEDEKHGILKLYPNNEHKTALIQVVELHKRIIAGDTVSQGEWQSAAHAAAYAAAYAADAADAAYAARAAAYAARAAAYAARAAADAADAAAHAAYAARAEFWQVLSVRLLELLASAPVGEIVAS